MTQEEILELIQTHIEGQGNQVDSGSVLPAILRGIIGLLPDPSILSTGIIEFDPTDEEVEAVVGKYYRADTAVDTLVVTLPEIEDEEKVSTVVLGFTTGTTPAITFTSADDKVIRMADGFEFEAEKTYEVNALYNGSYWSIAGIVIAPAV